MSVGLYLFISDSGNKNLCSHEIIILHLTKSFYVVSFDVELSWIACIFLEIVAWLLFYG